MSHLSLLAAALLATVCACTHHQGAPPMSPSPASSPSGSVLVKVFDAEGRLVGPLASPKVVKSEAEWRAQLTPEQYRITRASGTERAFCGTLLDNKQEGVYACVACGLPLFSSDAKFNSGTGWPSFFQPIARENVTEIVDASHGMVRTEIRCARCESHLGHVFDDGPRPTGLRFCLNSEALDFTEAGALASLADPLAAGAGAGGATASVVLAGGCFWCVEAVFEELEGVLGAESGYAGGSAETANYEDVCSGQTGHAEVVRVSYDPAKISYLELLEVFFATHDPTTLNAQGPDSGTQYRSAIFPADDAEAEIARAYIDDLTAAGVFKRPIVTSIEPGQTFHPAETYHQNYVCNNPGQGYVRGVALPKVEKLRAKFPDKLKARSPLSR